MSTPLKLLFLHGYTQSGPLFHAKTKALEKLLLKSLPAGTTLSFPTAPHLLKLSDLPGHTPAASAGNEGGAEEEEQSADNWAWWRRNDATGEYTGLNETWAFLGKLLDSEGPFDGCIGFSQGGALTSLLTSLLEPAHAPSRPASFTTTHPPFRFSIVYSGFRAPSPHYDYFYTPKIATPTLHFIGSLDTVVDESRSLALVHEHAGEPRVVYHPGGHYLPAGKQFANVVVGFVREHAKPVVGVEEEGVEDMDVPF
ncbi:uncharacterized protein LAJ45_06692 [Morchella importuna]|uniref:FSH1-domain-containing protein n=1 Tax=Morchella conica CCBAS932 TaxID=1392247 RepID=A0A3N4KK69_9PEZI|nr:uncharacterized protein LAJ45_06692 [Morchella importuna]KAH8149153.1 hypothetical protein LAJ45_06692 [Morchella importuna]RPB08721.1 FSH1-domain-containing protein [Morchella conica CCBAS932]